VLYEMLTGRRAFRGATRADTLTAVLQQDPPSMTIEGGRTVAPALERVVRRCLEKDPEDRFQSARDVAFALEAFAGTGTESAGSRPSRGTGEPVGGSCRSPSSPSWRRRS
jgi:serine/threonine protein kinase